MRPPAWLLAEHPAAAVEDPDAEALVAVAEVPGGLVEDEPQSEGEVLVLHAGVPGPDRTGRQPLLPGERQVDPVV